MAFESGNLTRNERLVSVGAGAFLSAMALRSGGPIVRLLAGVGGISLLARALAGHCGMKSALTGESSLREGLTQQWHHTKAQLSRASEQTAKSGAAAAAAAEKVVREQGPSGATNAGAEGAGWMSHQSGRVTGTGVTPGSGDAEAGTSGQT